MGVICREERVKDRGELGRKLGFVKAERKASELNPLELEDAEYKLKQK